MLICTTRSPPETKPTRRPQTPPPEAEHITTPHHHKHSHSRPHAQPPQAHKKTTRTGTKEDQKQGKEATRSKARTGKANNIIIYINKGYKFGHLETLFYTKPDTKNN